MATNKQNQGSRSSSDRASQNRQSQKQSSSKGRGWHGDSEGHAKAGSQSHKND